MNQHEVKALAHRLVLVREAKQPKIDALRLVPTSLEAVKSDPYPFSVADDSNTREAEQRRNETQAAYAASERYGAANVPARYRLTETIAKDPGWVKVYKRARDLVGRAGSLVVLTGDRGTGKTHLACELIRAACWNGQTARYETWADICRRWRESLVGDDESERRVVNELSRYGLLVIDEIDVAKDGDFGDRSMRELIDRRYRNLRSTVMLSNLSVEALAKKLDPSILSRMQECGEIIPCAWPSFRAKANG